jgi:hypothetical protein
MRSWLKILALALVTALAASPAAGGWFTDPQTFEIGHAVASSTVAATTSATVGLDSSKYLPSSGAYAGKYAQWALITVEENDIRFWANGNDPTADEGHYIYSGGVFLLKGSDAVKNFRAIGISDTATLQVTYGY